MPKAIDKSSARRKMQKRIETKEDGRLIIYYTFSEKPDSKPEAARK